MMRIFNVWRTKMLGLMILLIPALAPAQTTDEGFWNQWAQPGVHAIMRHATAPGFGDPDNFQLGDCSTQRNLDSTGRQEARVTGLAFKQRGPLPDAVYASQWCRTTETAELLDFKPVQPLPSLNSFFQGRGDRLAQTASLKQFLAEVPDGQKLFLVTHQVNISAFTGRFTQSGEVLLFRIEGEEVRVLASRQFD